MKANITLKFLFIIGIICLQTLSSYGQSPYPNWLNTGLPIIPTKPEQIITMHDTIYVIDQKILYYSYDNLNTWDTLFALKGDTSFKDMAAVNSTILAATNHGVYMSSNNGQTFTKKDTSNTLSIAINNNKLYAGTLRGVNFSNDLGLTWTIKNTGLQDSVMNTFAFNGTNILAGSNKGFYKSNKNTLNWTKINIGITDNILSIQSIGSNIYAASAANQSLYLSQDNGNNWSTTPFSKYFNSIAVQDSNVFISELRGTSGNGVYWSKNKGQTWTYLGFNSDYVNTLRANDGYLFAGTMSLQSSVAAVYKYNLSNLASVIKDNKVSIEFNVYPVPSNNGKFTIDLSNKGAYFITVFNSLGEDVGSENMSELSKEIDLSKLKKGIYFLKIESENRIGTSKLIIE